MNTIYYQMKYVESYLDYSRRDKPSSDITFTTTKGKNGNQRNSIYRPGIGGKKVHSGGFSQTNLFFSASAGVSGNLSGEQSRKRRIPVKTDRVAGIELASVGK